MLESEGWPEDGMKQEMPRALTQLSEDERLFQASVREFAADRIAPLVRQMDESQVFETALLKQLFELGLMGIEVPRGVWRCWRNLL